MNKIIQIIKEEINALIENPEINDIVWRAGGFESSPYSGGIWFGENKEDVEKFVSSVRNEKRLGKPYRIRINNPKHYDGHWWGYLKDVEKYGGDRGKLMNDLISAGYDGIIIDTDTWNDTGDDNSVTSKQYVVFDKNNISPA